MATTEKVLDFSTSTQRHVYREFGGAIGIFCQERCRPKMISAGLNNWNLGLYDYRWSQQIARHSGTATYFVRVEPIYGYYSDPDGLPLRGTPTTINATKGTTFTFDPFPDGFPCTGYRVYAGTSSTTLYYQGELTNRFQTTFEIGVTWTLAESGTVIDAVTQWVPTFATALEVYQAEGANDARCFFGGGKKYSTGYAKIATATAAPVLTGGTAGTTTIATWQAVTAGSFRMRLAWVESTVNYDSYFDWTGINLSGIASMADVASTLQTTIRAAKAPVLYSGTGYETNITKWNAITAGSFDIYVNGAVVHVTGCNFATCATMTDVAAIIQAAWRTASTGSTETVTWDATATKFVFRANKATPTALHDLSYLSSNSSGTGTDISSKLDGREDSSSSVPPVLNRRGKGATTETVAYSTDHFVITGSATGDQYELGYLTEATADVGTDISTASYLDCRSTSQLATYVSGATALRTVWGKGTNWGTWAIGMKFKGKYESNEYLVTDVRGSDHILLDSDYSGGMTARYNDYILLPYSDQIYISEVGSPFAIESLQKLPTADSDEVTAIRRVGRNIAIFMKHHTWVVDGVNITSPRLVSSQYGAPSTEAIIEYGDGLAIWTGKEFVFYTGGSFQNLDQEGKMKEIISRISINTDRIHGQYIQDNGVDTLIWFTGLDSGYKYAYALKLYPKTGSWCIGNYKDANCSTVVRDETSKQYLITGSTYDSANSAKAFTFLHGSSYKSDGASQDSSKTVQGTISSVGTATTTAGYLSCGVFGNTLANLKLVTAGSFAITIDDVEYFISSIDFSGATDLAACATLIQTAIRTKTGSTETCTYSTNKFVITSATTTNRSNISYLRHYIPDANATSIAGKDYLNGEENFATKTYAVTKVTLTVLDMAGATPTLDVSGDGEMGTWVYVCDSNGKYGQYALIVSNTATTITVTPNFSTTPASGWYYYIGGIVPTWTKWFDWGSPNHKSKLHGVFVTATPDQAATGNYLFMLGMQGLSTTIRTAKKLQLGGSQDTTNTINLSDRPSTQHGITLKRPNSVQGLKIDDISLVHAPRV